MMVREILIRKEDRLLLWPVRKKRAFREKECFADISKIQQIRNGRPGRRGDTHDHTSSTDMMGCVSKKIPHVHVVCGHESRMTASEQDGYSKIVT